MMFPSIHGLFGVFISFVISAQDAFTDTASTELASHTPDTGTSWTTADNTNRLLIGAGATANAVTTHKTEDVWARENTDIGDDNMDVSLTLLTTPISDMRWGPTGRYPSGANFNQNQYTGYASKAGATLEFRLDKVVASTRTNLGTHADDPVANDVMKLEIRTAAKKLFVNDVEKISSSDDNLTGNQFAGISVNEGNSTRDHEVDNYLSGI